jgi:hypothetical protein
VAAARASDVTGVFVPRNENDIQEMIVAWANTQIVKVPGIAVRYSDDGLASLRAEGQPFVTFDLTLGDLMYAVPNGLQMPGG